MKEDLSAIRRDYKNASLKKSLVSGDPLDQFTLWMSDVLKSGVKDPTAMTLSTVGAHGRPSSRIVLLKDISKEGFSFFTNFESKKGNEILGNSFVSLNFYWAELERQVRIEGKAEKMPIEDSDRYFSLRPRGSKLGAWASPQSRKIESRKELENIQSQFDLEFKDQDEIPRPENWGGYHVIPDYFEFWQGRDNRLHDRIVYELRNGVWTISRIAP